jgi:alanine racemase
VKFNYSIADVASMVDGEIYGAREPRILKSIHFDTRLFDQGRDALFLCLNAKRKGSSFIPEAYRKGCHVFLVARESDLPQYSDVTYILVDDVLTALQSMASKHRAQFSYPVVGITGSFGKTIIKEWLNHFLKDRFQVIRSPKSYNSQIGVALSVLQMTHEHDLALFEAGISKPGEMAFLQAMMQPTLGVFTGLGTAHDDGFTSAESKLEEKAILFKNCKEVISEHFFFEQCSNHHWNTMQLTINAQSAKISVADYGVFDVPFTEKHKLHNLCAVLETLKSLGFPAEYIPEKIQSLPQVAMRMEVIQGKNNNVFVNDSYALDSMPEALAFLDLMAGNKSKLMLVGLNNPDEKTLQRLDSLKQEYTDLRIILVAKVAKAHQTVDFAEADLILQKTENTAILLKGQHGSGISGLISSHILRSHPTVLEISRQALRNNLTQFKRCIRQETKLMVMVKAAAYGVGAHEMASFLELEGIDYLGVAFPDEGVNLRKAGVQLPIMVMNTHEASFYDVIKYNLEPAIFSLQQLDAFTAELIRLGKSKYPVHLKIETGMNRLGFREEDLPELVNFLNGQPEIVIQSVYSHLAESGSANQRFTRLQLSRFDNAVTLLQSALSKDFIKHICNTDGIINYPEAHFDMVRLGIGLLGYAKLPGLEHAIALKTKISKINAIQCGESLGYDRSFIANKAMRVAVLPIGYADGFRRIFGNHKGAVYIENQRCPVLGNVCMDMTFVDVSELISPENAEVELLGINITVHDWAHWAQTIPYEVITSLSTRLNRIWVE